MNTALGILAEFMAAELPEIEGEDNVAFGPKRGGNGLRCLDLAPVTLVVIDRQREQPIPRFTRQAGDDH
jgi:hypothetical protein